MKNNLVINYETEDESIKIKLVYIVKREFKRYHVGKCYPIQTQCLFFMNGLLKNFGTVIKHENDKEDQELAYKLATKKALGDHLIKYLRKELWKEVLEQLQINTLLNK